jgi:two-component system cell cycle response regulator
MLPTPGPDDSPDGGTATTAEQALRSGLLGAPIVALRAALDVMRSAPAAGSESLRRIGSSIRHTTATLGLERAAATADALSTAADDDVLDIGASLLEQLLNQRVRAGTGWILLVEDDRVSAAVTRTLLTEEGHDVIVAGTGAEAERILETEQISLILLDLILPDMDGRTLLVNLRQRSATGLTPVLVTTARKDALTHAECFGLGADGFLPKPLDPLRLTTAVARALGRASQTSRGRTDSLTGLHNREAFEESLLRFLGLHQRGGLPLSFAIMDLDRFKAINDGFGHAMGDHVLRNAARTFANSFRSSDVLCRWGGDEFAALFPNTKSVGAAKALENAAAALKQPFQTPDGVAFAVTFSAGVIEIADHTSIESIVEAADQLLSMAKEAGRNRVCSRADLSDAPRPKVLLAEDEVDVANMIRKHLEIAGFDVVVCHDGASALAAGALENVSLALVDVKMPIMDGFELLKRLRAVPKCAALPVIMLTGERDVEDIVRGFDLGASDYVPKPFEPPELMARIRRLVKAR